MRIRFNFLNWRPDLEETEFEGLTIANGVYHDIEGWKPVTVATIGAISTITSTNNLFAPGVTISAMQIRQVGNLNDGSEDNKVAAYIRDAVSPQFAVDFFNTTTPASTTGANLMTTAYAVTAFQKTELNGTVFVCAQAEGEAASGTAVSLNITGYASID